MAKLSREETIVLNALIYIETDLWDTAGRTDGGLPKRLGDIVSELRQNNITANSGGMTEEECKALFDAVDHSPFLSQLELFQVRDNDYEEYHTQKSAAPVLAFQNGGNPVVVFRGTEPDTYEVNDNMLSGVASDTEAQKRALDYITILHDKYGFDNISVSGHSKGGNKAMYVTVLSDYVAECTAVDAPGFSAAFEGKYRERIEGQKDKITLIAPDQPMVASFFSAIAGNVIYFSTEGLSESDWELGGFAFHKPNTSFTIDGAGNTHMREESEPSLASRALNGLSRVPFAAALALGVMSGGEVFPELAEAVLGNFTEGAGRTVDNWLKGVYPDGSPALSTQIMNLLGGVFPGLGDAMNGGLASLAGGSESGPDIMTAVQYFGGQIPVLAAKLAEGTVSAGGMEMAVGSGVVIVMAAAAAVVWAFVKTLELAIPLLLNAGIAASVVLGYALGLAASRMWDALSGIGQAVVNGFNRAVDGLVRMGSLAVEGAGAARNAIASAVGSFIDGIAGFFGGIAEGASAWIQGIFGSADAAIAYAQDIDVTMWRIEEMRSCLGNLRQCYINAGNAAVGARQVTDGVYSYYCESYVRSCCRDIQYHLKSAEGCISSAERALDRKRRGLAEAAESYRRSDREAAGNIRRYGCG